MQNNTCLVVIWIGVIFVSSLINLQFYGQHSYFILFQWWSSQYTSLGLYNNLVHISTAALPGVDFLNRKKTNERNSLRPLLPKPHFYLKAPFFGHPLLTNHSQCIYIQRGWSTRMEENLFGRAPCSKCNWLILLRALWVDTSTIYLLRPWMSQKGR